MTADLSLTLRFAVHLDLATASEAARSLLFKTHHAMKAATRVPTTTQLTAIAIVSFKPSPAEPMMLSPGLDALDITMVGVGIPAELDGVRVDNPMVLAMRLPWPRAQHVVLCAPQQ